MARCSSCAGSGRVLLDKSWFPSDGMTSTKCWYCQGTGEAIRGFRPDPTWVRGQAARRERKRGRT